MDFDNRDKWDGSYEIIECKKALSPSKLPEMDFALNPYSGCAHGCVYCYAPEVTHKEWDTWRVVKVKSNIAARLEKEIRFVDGIIGIGTVTDPYQYAESRFCLTRSCLEVIKKHDKEIHMHTKSDLILRDLELIGEIRSKIAITITGFEDRYSKIVEPGAPLPEKRFDTLKTIADAGLNVYVLIGPVLSFLEGSEETFATKIIDTGVKTAYIDKLNKRPLLAERLSKRNIDGSYKSVEKIRKLLSDAGIKVNDVFQA